MPNKGEVPKSNPGVVPKTNIKQNKKNPVQKTSKLPRFINIVRPSTLNESICRIPKTVVAPKPNKTTVPTVPNANNETIGTKKGQTAPKLITKKAPVEKIVTDTQKNHGDSGQKPMLQRAATMLNPKNTQNKPNLKSFPMRFKTSICLPKTDLCHASKFRSMQIDRKLLVVEKNMLLQFKLAHGKLREQQSTFLEKWGIVKDITSTRITDSYKFITLQQNDNCKIIVKDENLLRLPKKLPKESVANFKETIKVFLYSVVELLDNHYKNNKIAKTSSLISDERKDRESKLKELMTNIDAMCKNESNIEVELARVLQESNRKFEQFKIEKEREHEVELIKIRKDAAAKISKEQKQWNQDMITLKENEKENESNKQEIQKLRQEIKSLNKEIIDLKTAKQVAKENEILLKDQIKQDNNKRMELLNKINELNNCIKDLQNDKKAIKDKEELLGVKITHKNNEIIDLLKENDCINEVTNDNRTVEIKSTLLEDQITQLKQALETYKNNIHELQAELEEKTQEPTMSPIEIREIYAFKQKLENTQKELKSIKEQKKKLEKELHLRDEKIITLQALNNATLLKVNTLMLENYEKIEKIAQLEDKKEIQMDHMNFLNNDLELKRNEVERLKHGIKLYEERCERNNNVLIKKNKKIAEQKEKITELKKKDCRKDKKFFEQLTLTEISDLNLHKPHCKYSKHKGHDSIIQNSQ